MRGKPSGPVQVKIGAKQDVFVEGTESFQISLVRTILETDRHTYWSASTSGTASITIIDDDVPKPIDDQYVTYVYEDASNPQSAALEITTQTNSVRENDLLTSAH